MVMNLLLLAPLFVWFPCMILLGSSHYQFANSGTSAYRDRIRFYNTGLSHTTIPAQQLYQLNPLRLNLGPGILTVTIYFILWNRMQSVLRNSLLSSKSYKIWQGSSLGNSSGNSTMQSNIIRKLSIWCGIFYHNKKLYIPFQL